LGQYWCFSFFTADTDIFALLKLQLKVNTVHFLSGHISKKINTQVTFMKKQIVKQALCILPHEQNIHSWNYFASSRTWLAELLTWQAWAAWLS